ncbi:MAG TPA: ABC transporter permease [Opitutaceae bacterium]
MRIKAHMAQVAADARYALRQLAKTPAYSLVVILTFALGIGACSAILTVVDSILLRPIAYPDSDRLMMLHEVDSHGAVTGVSPASVRAWMQDADCFESIAVRNVGEDNFFTRDAALRLTITAVTGRYFETLRVPAAHGRLISTIDDVLGQNTVAVLSHAFWQQQFGGDVAVVGTEVRVNGQPVTVIGILPRGFESDADQVFVPLGLPDEFWATPAPILSSAIGRLKPGVTVDQARQQLNLLAGRLGKDSPDKKDWKVQVTPLLEFKTRAVRPTFLALFGAVSLLLLIACANIANLILVRNTARHRELLVRSALGASRGRIVRQLLTESLILAAIGGLAGLVVAKVGVDAILAVAPENLPRADEVALDPRALAFTLTLTVLTGLGVGLAPAWSSAPASLADALKGYSGGGGGGRTTRFMREFLVVGELSLALVLLAGAGLLLRSFVRLAQVDPGFRPEQALMFNVYSGYLDAEKEKIRTVADAVVNRFRSLPGVHSVGVSYAAPFSGASYPATLDIEGRPVPVNERPSTAYFPVNPDYFRALGIPLLHGRLFTDHDRPGALLVAIVSQAVADRYFGGKAAIGRRIRLRGEPEPWREIVGVVGDVKDKGLRAESLPQIYEPFAQLPTPAMTFVVRGDASYATLAPALRRELRAVNPEVPVARIDTLDQLVANSVARERLAALILLCFSLAALIVAVSGIYTVTSFAVTQRTREFGIRLALGARPADLRRLVFSRIARLVGFALLAGGGGVLVVRRLFESLLYQTAPYDPIVLGLLAVLLAGVALVAGWGPSRRAATADPVVALRAE